MRRRRFLHTSATIFATGLAGCASLRSRHDAQADDVTVINETDTAVLADIVVARPDGDTVDSTRHRFPPGEAMLEDLAEYGTYDLTVAVDGMPAKSHEWQATDCNHLTVRVLADEVAFDEGEC